MKHINEIIKVLELMISRAEIWEGPITRRIRLNLWNTTNHDSGSWQI